MVSQRGCAYGSIIREVTAGFDDGERGMSKRCRQPIEAAKDKEMTLPRAFTKEHSQDTFVLA